VWASDASLTPPLDQIGTGEPVCPKPSEGRARRGTRRKQRAKAVSVNN